MSHRKRVYSLKGSLSIEDRMDDSPIKVVHKTKFQNQNKVEELATISEVLLASSVAQADFYESNAS